uniref:EF-hand domain-containing protein n=1 Tax=Plectus sambesii TaxID=2011161 RepID=A0A914W5Z9_9BILA
MNTLAIVLLLVLGSFYALAEDTEPDMNILPDTYKEETHDEEFKRADANGDGKLDKCEYVNINKWAALSNEEEFKECDKNADGFVSKDEQDAFLKKQEEDNLRWRIELFKSTVTEYDTNGDNLLQENEFIELLKMRYSYKPNADFPFAKFDTNGDKGIDGEELEKFDANIPVDYLTFIDISVDPATL